MSGYSDLTGAIYQGLTHTGQHAVEAGTQVSAPTHERALICEADFDFVIDALNIDLTIGDLGSQPTADLLILTLGDVLALLSVLALGAVKGLLLRRR